MMKIPLYKSKLETHNAIIQAVSACRTDYEAEVRKHGESQRLEKTFKHKLGYIIMDLLRVGERGLRLLLS